MLANLDNKTPWAQKAGLTAPYFNEQFAVGIPPGMAPPTSLAGIRVAAKAGDTTASSLAKKHAVAIRQQNLSHPMDAVAAPVWELRHLGLSVTKFQLFEVKHVMAVPPGENAWLKRLTEFLISRKSTVEPLLGASNAE